MQGELQSHAREVRELVNRDIDPLRNLQVTITAAIGQADQAEYETDQTHNERYQARLATLAGVLLAPALVASIFGANQMFGDSPFDLIWLFLAMFIAGSATWVVIRLKLGRGLGNPVLRLRSQAPGERRPTQTSEVQADTVADGPLGKGVA